MPTVTEARLAVRYQETDQMAIVYHTNYFVWFEIGRTDYVHQVTGRRYAEWERETGILLPVLHARADYHAPARYGDDIVVCTRIIHLNKVRIHFGYEVYREDAAGRTLLVTGETHHAWVNRDMKPVRLDRTAPEFYAQLKAAAGL